MQMNNSGSRDDPRAYVHRPWESGHGSRMKRSNGPAGFTSTFVHGNNFRLPRLLRPWSRAIQSNPSESARFLFINTYVYDVDQARRRLQNVSRGVISAARVFCDKRDRCQTIRQIKRQFWCVKDFLSILDLSVILRFLKTFFSMFNWKVTSSIIHIYVFVISMVICKKS